MSFDEFVTSLPIAADCETEIGVWHTNDAELMQTGWLNIPVHTILLVCSGALSISIRGEELVLTEGYYTDLRPDNQLRILSAIRQTEVWCLFFEGNSIQKIFRHRQPVTMAYIDHLMHKKTVLLSKSALHTLALSLETLYDTLLSEDHPNRSLLLTSKFKIFFLEVNHIFAQLLEDQASEPNNRPRYEYLFSQFVALLHKHAQSQHSVEFYAEQLCITPQYLGRIVRTIAQQKVYSFISFAVVGVSAVVLSDFSLSLKQVAAQMHFPDQAAFTKFYKRYTGQTPMQFRNRLK